MALLIVWAVVSGPLAFVCGCVGGDGTPLPVRSNRVWSPDGSRILFVSNRDGNWEIYAMDADGSGQQRLTNNAGEDRSPCWSPDGSRIVFHSVTGGIARIWTMNATGGDLTQLATGIGIYPDWSPDGQRIAFIRGSDIWTMSASDGSSPQRLTNSAGGVMDPAWSPDSAWIAFVSDMAGTWQVYLMRADGTDVRQLTTDATSPSSPSWSRDGLRVYYCAPRAYSVALDGTDRIELTDHQAYGYRTSPNGRKAAYVEWVPSNPPSTDTDVFVANADDSNSTNITHTPGHDWLY